MLELSVLLIVGTKRVRFFSNRSITRNSHGCCLSLRFHIVVVFDNFKTMAAANSETKYQNVETNAF